MKPILITLVVLVLFAGRHAAFALPADGAQETIAYRWSFVAKAGPAQARIAATISRDTVMRTGEEFKMMVNLQSRAFVYVIHKSPVNELAVLFPYDFDAVPELQKNYYLPKGRTWFKLDAHVGDETFYILASRERLTELEQLLRTYAAAASAKRPQLVTGIVTKIKDLKKKYRLYTTLAERPISIAGNVRGTDTKKVDVDRIDIATLASEISAGTFYSKTITIEHK